MYYYLYPMFYNPYVIQQHGSFKQFCYGVNSIWIRNRYPRENSCREAARISATMDYVNRNLKTEGFDGGFPNFQGGINVFKKDAVEWRDVSKSVLGNPDKRDVGAMMRAAHDYARAQGYNGGVPTFAEGQDVYGIYLFKSGMIDWYSIKAVDLENPNQDVASRFKAVQNYINKNSLPYVGAFPNFYEENHPDNGLVYQVLFLKPEATVQISVSDEILNVIEYQKSFGCLPLSSDQVIVACISGRSGSTGEGRGMLQLRDKLREQLAPLKVNENNIFTRSWHHSQDDNPVGTPWIEDLLREIYNRTENPSYIAILGHSYGGWAACRLSRATSKVPDFVGLIDPVFGPTNTFTNADIPRGNFIKNWYQNNNISGGDPCTGFGKIPCIPTYNGISCGYKNVPGAHENINENFIKDWDGNRKRVSCGMGPRPHILTSHVNIDEDKWIHRQICDQIYKDISKLIIGS